MPGLAKSADRSIGGEDQDRVADGEGEVHSYRGYAMLYFLSSSSG